VNQSLGLFYGGWDITNDTILEQDTTTIFKWLDVPQGGRGCK